MDRDGHTSLALRAAPSARPASGSGGVGRRHPRRRAGCVAAARFPGGRIFASAPPALAGERRGGSRAHPHQGQRRDRLVLELPRHGVSAERGRGGPRAGGETPRPTIGDRERVRLSGGCGTDDEAVPTSAELDYGATAVSLPITNDAGLLQVSPGDGLTSLTGARPDAARRARALLPLGRRSFVRVGPTDLREAEGSSSGCAGRDRFGFVFDREIYGRARGSGARRAELGRDVTGAGESGGAARRATTGHRGCAGWDGRPEGRPPAVVSSAWPAPALLVAMADQLPGAAGVRRERMLARPARFPPGMRLEAFGPRWGPSARGYEAMRLVLDAVRRGGRDRRRVIAAALAGGATARRPPGSRSTGRARTAAFGGAWTVPRRDFLRVKQERHSPAARIATPLWLGCAQVGATPHRRDTLASTLAGSLELPARRLRPGPCGLRRRRRRSVAVGMAAAEESPATR